MLRQSLRYVSSHLACLQTTCKGRLISRSVATASNHGQREKLMTELKTSMKARDTFTTTVLRSVLAELNTADKGTSGPVPDTHVLSILRKAIARRVSPSFISIGAHAPPLYPGKDIGSRPELAEVEKREADFLSSLLPPSLPEDEIDSILEKIAKEKLIGSQQDPKRIIGLILKDFYSEVDKSAVDGKTVKLRLDLLLKRIQG